MEKRCQVCNKVFFAKRITGKFCSAACRVKASRDVSDESPIIVPIEKAPTENEWLNSAETKTLEERLAHYTLKNFPARKYYSLNGGGSGAYSPYPQSNPLSEAYIFKTS